LLDVLTKYVTLGFCRLGLNRLKFYRTKTWDIMTKNQISANYRYIESITGSPILQIYQFGKEKPRRNGGAIYAFSRVIFLRFVDVRCKLL
jgi:hypothetical protein